MTCPRATLIVAAVAGLWCTGCGSESKGPDTGQPAELGGPDVGVKPEGGTRPEAAIKPEGGTGNTIEVTYNTESIKVDLTKPQPVTVGGVSCARLSDVVLLAFPGKDLATLTADFSDPTGYRPSTKANCQGYVPVAGEKLAKGYVALQTHDMEWDADLGFPGCLGVKGMSKIILANK